MEKVWIHEVKNCDVNEYCSLFIEQYIFFCVILSAFAWFFNGSLNLSRASPRATCLYSTDFLPFSESGLEIIYVVLPSRQLLREVMQLNNTKEFVETETTAGRCEQNAVVIFKMMQQFNYIRCVID